MADVTMPRLSDTMQEGTIARWLKKPGDAVQRGDTLAEIETDKATMDLEAYDSGTLQEVLSPEGATVPIGQVIARIGAAGAAPTPAPTQGQAEPSAPRAQAAEAPAPVSDKAPARGTEAVESASAPAPAEKAPVQAPEEASARAEKAPAPEQTEKAAGEARQAPRPADGTAPGQQPPTAPATSQPRAESAPQADAPAAAAQSVPPRAGAEGRPAVSPESAPPRAQTPAANGAAAERPRASPLARRIAEEHGLDLASIQGSGPDGRIVSVDVEAALARGQAAQPAETDADGSAEATPPSAAPAAPGADDELVPLSSMRRVIARRMAESTRTIPHFFLTVTVDATELVTLRQQVNRQLEAAGEGKVSVNDLVIRAVALAARKVPDVNVSFTEEGIVRHRRVHVGNAVALDNGLIVPVIRDADSKGVAQIARESRDLAQRARAGKLKPEEFSGGTISVSNLGMFGVEQFNAVINPPEAAILAIGAVTREPVEHEGAVVVRERMRITMSIDHRATDGATGARYLQALRQLLEQPLLLLL